MALRAARTEGFPNKRLKQLRVRVMLLCLTVLARLRHGGAAFQGRRGKIERLRKNTRISYSCASSQSSYNAPT